MHLKSVYDVVEKTQSPQHFIDTIKWRILYEEQLHETVESLNRMCFLELMWLYERIVIREKVLEASEKDYKIAEATTQLR